MVITFLPTSSNCATRETFTKGISVNKSQLIEALSRHFEGNKKSASHALESVLDTVTRELVKGNKVAITGFGAFEKVDRPARMVRNPRTGERTRAKKTSVPKFRPGADLKATVSGAKKLPKVTATTSTSAAKKSASTSSSTTKKTAAKATPAKRTAASTTSTTKKTAARSTPAARKTTAKSASPTKRTTGTSTSAAKKTATKSTSARSSTAKPSSAAKRSTAKKTTKKS